MMDYRTDLAMERTVYPGGLGEGVAVQTQHKGSAEITWVRIETPRAAERLGKAEGTYWTMTHPELPCLDPEERMDVARQVAQVLRLMLPPKGDVLVLGLGNRRMTADALGDRVVSGILVTRHMKEMLSSAPWETDRSEQDDTKQLRSVCAMSPGVLGITGVETAELAMGLVERLRPSAVVVVDALAAMETDHIGTTIQLTDTGIRPGSGVGNHRAAITKDVLQVPVIAIGIPMVVYASTIVRDALKHILASESSAEAAHEMAEQLTGGICGDMVVTPRNIDELVAGLADMLALAVNSALQPAYTIDELSHYLH
ncbi:MAG: GPR endopeptidase [Clostridia bacterium]|nr:GPR endopeptidase [Clostridia bacterium]